MRAILPARPPNRPQGSLDNAAASLSSAAVALDCVPSPLVYVVSSSPEESESESSACTDGGNICKKEIRKVGKEGKCVSQVQVYMPQEKSTDTDTSLRGSKLDGKMQVMEYLFDDGVSVSFPI